MSGRAIIVGAGRSGLALARLLRAEGLEPALADERVACEDLPADLDGIPFLAGPFQREWLAGAGSLLLSPGVPDDAPAVRWAREAGLRVSGEVEEAFRRCAAPVLAITGTNGKSTTTTLVSLFLEASGRRAPAGGNLGRPFSALLLEEPDAELYVLEISSFQCETMERFSPQAATLLNLAPDHLDRYRDAENYYAAKLRLFARLGPADHLVLPAGDPLAARFTACPARRLWFGRGEDAAGDADGAFLRGEGLVLRQAGAERPLLPATALRLVGRHNVDNALAAAALAMPFGAGPEAMAGVLREFSGLPHRMEALGELGPLRVFNDSKATNVAATLASLGGLPGPLLLVAGGRDKGGDFRALAAALPQVRRAYGIGEAGPDVVAAFGERGRLCGDLEAAAAAAVAEGKAGEWLVLSPACASQDQYRDFEERGEHLRRIVAAGR